MYPSQGTSAARVLPRLLPPERGFFPSGSQGVTPPLSPPYTQRDSPFWKTCLPLS